jgi:transposase-like protein
MNRNRTDPAIVRYGLYLYVSFRSFRLAAKCLSSSVIKRTHVSIWKYVQKYSELAADRFRINKHAVKKIFVDETMLKIYGQDYWL